MITEQIADLAANGAFQQLSPDEQTLVLAAMTPNEFDRLHQLLTALPEMDQHLTPPDSIRTHLLEHDLLSTPAVRPVWHYMAGLAVAFLAGILATVLTFNWLADKPVAAPVTEKVLVQHDTLWRIDTVVVTRWRTRERQIVVNTPPMAADIQPEKPVTSPPLPVMPTEPQFRSASMREVPLLMQFMGVQLAKNDE